MKVDQIYNFSILAQKKLAQCRLIYLSQFLLYLFDLVRCLAFFKSSRMLLSHSLTPEL